MSNNTLEQALISDHMQITGCVENNEYRRWKNIIKTKDFKHFVCIKNNGFHCSFIDMIILLQGQWVFYIMVEKTLSYKYGKFNEILLLDEVLFSAIN